MKKNGNSKTTTKVNAVKKTPKKKGRPSKFSTKYINKLTKHFDVDRTRIITEVFYYKNGDKKEKEIEVANELPTIGGFCNKVGISKDTFHQWVKRHKTFSDAYKKAKSMQEEMWIQNSLRGLYNPAFTIFAGKNMFEWRDRQELDHTSKGKKLNQPKVVGFYFLPPVKEEDGGSDTNDKTDS